MRRNTQVLFEDKVYTVIGKNRSLKQYLLESVEERRMADMDLVSLIGENDQKENGNLANNRVRSL